MKRLVILLAVPLLVTVVPSASANTTTTLRQALQIAVCQNNWEQAIITVQQLISSSDVSSGDRHYFMELRRQFQNYRSNQTRIDTSQTGACQQIANVVSDDLVVDEQSQPPPLDWHRAATSVQAGARSQVTPVASRGATSGLSANQQSVEPQRTVFRVGDGDGGRYEYQLWRNWNGSEYYLFVWRQGYSLETAPMQALQFVSSSDALDYFDCEYGERIMPRCNVVRGLVRAYNSTASCQYPWQQARSGSACASE
jgi:hypothetical protein